MICFQCTCSFSIALVLITAIHNYGLAIVDFTHSQNLRSGAYCNQNYRKLMGNLLLHRHTTEAPVSDAQLLRPDGTPFEHSAEELETAYTALEWFLKADHPISRRTVLGLGAVMLSNIALHYIEKPIMDSHYGVSDTTIMIPQPFSLESSADHAGLVSPGWGGTHGKSIVTEFRDADIYHRLFPLGYYHFSNHSVTVGGVRDCGKEYANKLDMKRLDIHGISEGTMIALTGALGVDKPIRVITSNDSPFNIDDAQHALGAKLVAWLNEMKLYHGGLMGKYAVCLLEEVDKHGLHKLVTGLGEAAHSTWTGADPRMMDSQLVFMKEADLHGRRKEFKRIINSDTTVLVMQTAHTSTDKIVKDHQATEHWLDFYDYLGAKVMVLMIEKPGHANLSAGVQASAPHLRPIIA